MHSILRRAAILAAVTTVSTILHITPAAAQTPPSILGTYSGTFSGNDFNCSDPNDDGPFSGTTTFSIVDQQGGNFFGIGTADDGVSVDNITISGTIAPDGSVSGVLLIDDPIEPGAASLAGSLVGDTLNLSFDGADVFCSFIGTISASRSSTAAIIPDVIPSNILTTAAEIDSFLRGQPVANSSRIRNVLTGAGRNFQVNAGSISVSGMSAAEGSAMPLGAWAAFSYSDTENDFITTAFTSKRYSMLFGIDTQPTDDTLLGVSVGLERSEVKTAFNLGEQQITAITLAPYFGMLFNEWLTFDITAGISDVQNDQFRTAGTARVTSDVESLRFFANANVAATYTFAALRLTGQGGVLWATQRDDDFQESNGLITPESSFNVGRFLLGGEVAYSLGAWEPYVNGLFEHDFTRTKQRFAAGVLTPKNDDSDLLLSVGLRYFGANNVSGYLEYSTLIGRRNIDEDTISASLRWAF